MRAQRAPAARVEPFKAEQEVFREPLTIPASDLSRTDVSK